MTTELIKQEVLTPTLFEDDKVEIVLASIKERAKLFIPDLTTKHGRKEIASFAMKIAKCKTGIDGIGKDLVAKAKADVKLVDNKRKLVRDTLDALKEEVRRPLTEFEDAEKARVTRLNDGVNNMRDIGDGALLEWGSLSLTELQEKILILDDKNDGTWEEFNDAAIKAIKESKEKIEQAIVKRIAYDAEQDELIRLRQEAAVREQKERNARIAKEAVVQERERIAEAQVKVGSKPIETTKEVSKPIIVKQVKEELNTLCTISIEEYEQLKSDSRMLEALVSAGVDNWSGYDEAMEELAA